MASRSLGQLTIDLIARVSGFEQGMDKAARISSKRMKEIEKSAAATGKAIGVAFVAVSGAIAALVKSSINAADELSKMSQKVGVSTEELSGLKYAADLSDVSLESLSSALQKQGKNAVEAAKGTGAAAEAYAALGISVKNADGTLKSNAQLFEESAEAISKFADGPKKQAIGVAIFGKAFADLVPLLNGGKEGLRAAREELERFGGIVDTNTGKLAEDFNDTLTRIKTIVSGLGLTLAKEFLPHMREFVEKFKDPEFQKKIKETVGGLADLIIVVAKSGASLGTFLANVGKDDADSLQTLFKRAAALRTQIENLEAGGGILSALGNDPTKDLAGFRAELEKTETQIESMRKAIVPGILGDIFGGTDGVTIPLRRPTTGGGGGQNDAPDIPDLAAAAAAAKALADQNKAYIDKTIQDAIEQQEQLAASADALTRSLETPSEAYRRQVQELDRLFNSYDEFGNRLITAETHARGMAAALEDLDATYIEMPEHIKEAADGLTVFAEQAMRNTQDIIANALIDGFDGGVKGILKSFADMIKQLAAQALAAEIAKKLFGDKSTGTSGSSGSSSAGIINTIIGAIGAYFGGAGARASGGPVSANSPYMVGESGPELFVPNMPGTVVSNKNLSAGGQSIRIVNAWDTSVIGDWAGSVEGERAIINAVRKNGTQVKEIVQT